MVGINADGYNWDFIVQNINNYVGSGKIWYLFPILLLVILKFTNKQTRVIGFYPYLIFACTVCNPFIISIVGKKIGLSDRYYRFFWILPLGIMVGCLCAVFVDKIGSRVGKIVVIVGVLITILILGSPVYNSAFSPSYMKRENNYFTTDTVIGISRVIHKYSKTEPIVLYPSEIMYDICQFDANANSYLDRGEAWAILDEASDEMLDWIVADCKYEKIVKYIYVSGRIDKASTELMKEAFGNTGVNFLVLPQSNEALIEYYKDVGCELVGNCDGYDVLYYGTEKPN